jgi:hypothetical protein
MWKLVIGFIVLAAIAIYVLSKGGDIDMSGEKHGSAASLPSQPATMAMKGRRARASGLICPAPKPASCGLFNCCRNTRALPHDMAIPST